MFLFRKRNGIDRFLFLIALASCLALPVQAWSGASARPAASVTNWAFQPLAHPAVPPVKNAAWVLTPVDAFILARQEAAGLDPAPVIGRRALIRRVTFDLTGLPPTPEEVERFLADDSPDAYETVVDRLLASPRYGERWARHWLDVVRYADTDGFAIDSERPTLWRYRDYVVRTLNEDRPFDRFIREQLAGDELNAGSEGVVATGFYRLGPWEADNMVPENKRQDYLNEITSTVGAAFLGLTVGCARCHDHKYDPIPTADFYSLQAFFAPLKRDQPAAAFLETEMTGEVSMRQAQAEAELGRRRDRLAQFRADLKAELAASRDAEVAGVSDDDLDRALGGDREPFAPGTKKKLDELKKAVADYKEPGRFAPVACAVSDPSGNSPPPETHVLMGGNLTAPGKAVVPAFLTAVRPWRGECYRQLSRIQNTAAGRRKVLAEWIASSRNPLTARVLVNRLWQYHFGSGIVATPNDFGRNGSGPSHPQLLDYLAGQLIGNGWKLKSLHRLLVLSRTYRLSTSHPKPEKAERIDPDDRLLWRARYRRLEAEVLRDTMLAVSGRLQFSQGGPGYFDKLPQEMGRNFPFFTWDPSPESERVRRSLYLFQRRNMVVPLMESFDAAGMSASCARRGTSVTTPQVFSLFNSEFAHETSRHFARRVRAEAGPEPRRQIERVFQLAFGRAPVAAELEAGLRFLKDHARGEKDRSNAGADTWPALSDLCLVALNANEFLYLE